MAAVSKTGARTKSWFAWIFILGIFFFLMQAGLFAGHISGSRVSQRLSRPHWFSFQRLRAPPNDGSYSLAEHPIPKLMDDAEEKFKHKLSRQSKTLQNAVVEYRRRYGREPPKGFGDWWQFAREHDVKLVDEFDVIHEDLAPFWDISGAEFRARAFEVSANCLNQGAMKPILQVGDLPSIDLVRVVDGKTESASVDISSGEHGKRAFGFLSLLQKFAHTV